MISSEESVIDNLDLSHIPTVNQFALSSRGLPLTTVTLYLVLHIIGPIYMLMANYDNIHSPSFRIYFHRLNEFVFAKTMMQYNRAREKGWDVCSGVAIMEQMEQVLPPDISGTFYSAENALKFTYSKVEFQKNSGGNTPGPPL